MAKSGSPSVLRLINDRAALDVLVREPAVARADLEREVGLSKPATAELLNRLERAGLVERVGQRDEGPGPRAQLWGLRAALGYAAGVDITAAGIDVAIAGLRGDQVGEAFLDADPDRDPIEQLVEAVAAACAAAGIESSRLSHVSAGLPGAVDPQTGHLRYASPAISAWTGIDLPTRIADALGVPVSIENDVNLVALNEVARGVVGDAKDFVLIWISERGVGASVVLGGELLRGATSGAGEIGFTIIADLAAQPDEPQYGRFGDLVSADSLIALVRRQGIEADTARDGILRALDEGGRGEQVVTDVARRIAAVIAGIVSLIDPELIVLDGDIGVAGGERLCSSVSRELAELVSPQVRIVPGHDDSGSVRSGAVHAALIPAREEHFARGSAIDVPH